MIRRTSHFARASRVFLAALVSTALIAPLAACGQSNEATDGTTEITLWTWQSTIDGFVSAFEKSHPDIKVKVQNVGTNDDEYMQLNNAISAGKGVPDLIYLDYNAVQQFAISGELRDVAEYGFDDIADDFTDSALNAVTNSGARYALPISSGPMVMFYNAEIFKEAGIDEPPTTWDEYAEAAAKIKALGNGKYIANETGDGGFLASMLWQAGARPFTADGETIGIDFTGSNVRKFTDMWQPLMDKELIDTNTKGWTEDWYQALNNGRIATILTGAWMVTSLKKNVSGMSGKWRVAPMPQYQAGEHVNGENGGGALALPAKSDDAKAEAAYAFAKWYAHDGGVDVNLAQDGVPPLNAVFDDKEYLNATDDYFGGQQIHQVIAEAAKDVDARWQYLPYMAYANSIAVNTIGKAYIGRKTLNTALNEWGEALAEYGRQEGFTVK